MSQIKADRKLTRLTIPLLPLRDVIIFPHMVVPLFVGREKSINALEESANRKRPLMLAAQRQANTVNPGADDIFQVGTLGTILQLLRLPDNTVKVLIEGKQRGRILNYTSTTNYLEVQAEEMVDHCSDTVEVRALVRSLKATFENYVKLNKRIGPDMLLNINAVEDPVRLGDLMIAHLNLKLEDKQSILEAIQPVKRLEKFLNLMQGEIEILQVERRIRSRVKKQMERSQKEYYLNEQIQAIQKELGDKDEFKAELIALEKQIRAQKLSVEARDKATRELKKLRMMSPMSAEATVVRNYIDWILSLPWNEYTIDRLDLPEAQSVLDEDHYGLEEVKERILEYLAVRILTQSLHGPILCLVGPPGVGKTSLAKSIAHALGRKFIRCSLGGVRDEAEIRGHRRTYVGALPGKMIQSLKKCGSSNPVFLLDEVDKMSMDFRGDPSSALLEVLDPEQNATFSDHYLEVDFDLSKVMFILTANSLHPIPKPMLDRMEVINIAGYTEMEKFQIATRYLVEKQRKVHGLTAENLVFDDESIGSIIRTHTREAGVRSLERTIAKICRKAAKAIIVGRSQSPDLPSHSVQIQNSSLESYLGPPKFLQNQLEEQHLVGLANGLAFTDTGGDLLQIEVSVVPGKGQVKITGKLGEVMQESAATAVSYVRSRATLLGLEREFYQSMDIHLHVPEGAVPKDGPSAGVTMATAITSALIRVAVRRDLAMTGEITLRGRVLPVGGLKEKLLAAKAGQIKTVLIPKGNLPDLKKVPSTLMEGMEIIPVEHADEVLRLALQLEHPAEFLVARDVDLPVISLGGERAKEDANAPAPAVKH